MSDNINEKKLKNKTRKKEECLSKRQMSEKKNNNYYFMTYFGKIFIGKKY